MNTQWAAAVVVLTFLAGVLCTAAARRIATRVGAVDKPGEERKIHKTPTPLFGGVAVGVAFIAGASLLWPELTAGYLLPKHVTGVCIGVLVLMIGGALDDKYNLSPAQQIITPVLAALIMIAAGAGIAYITNPLGGVLQLDTVQFELFRIGDTPYHLTVWADLFSFLWLLGMMYTTKFLDGLDGLVSGVTVIGMVILFVLSISEPVLQPETGWLALIAAAAFAGFLVWNWNPARIFLGESGSLIAGFLLGTIAIISGAKIATALLIMGIPILDVAWVILRRFVVERRSPFQADRKHLHLRLLDAGLSHKQTVLLLYVFTAGFGITGLYLHSFAKLLALAAVGLAMFLLSIVLVRTHDRTKK